MGIKDIIRLETTQGERVVIDDVAVTPQAQALTVRLPFARLVWNRPVAVLVERGARTERLGVVDVTRLAQMALFGFSLFLSWKMFGRSKRKRGKA